MQTTDKILARFTASRAFPTWAKGAVITVQAQADNECGNAHFSVTAKITTPANGFYWLAGASGGLGERYHGGSEKTPEQCMSILAESLRISPETALKLREACQEAYQCGKDSVATGEDVTEAAQTEQNKAGNAKARQVFAQFVASQRPIWAAEAQAGLALIETLNARQAARKAAKEVSK